MSKLSDNWDHLVPTPLLPDSKIFLFILVFHLLNRGSLSAVLAPFNASKDPELWLGQSEEVLAAVRGSFALCPNGVPAHSFSVSCLFSRQEGRQSSWGCCLLLCLNQTVNQMGMLMQTLVFLFHFSAGGVPWQRRVLAPWWTAKPMFINHPFLQACIMEWRFFSYHFTKSTALSFLWPFQPFAFRSRNSFRTTLETDGAVSFFFFNPSAAEFFPSVKYYVRHSHIELIISRLLQLR